LRSAHTSCGVYRSIIAQALTFAPLLGFCANDMGFGGNDGMTYSRTDREMIIPLENSNLSRRTG
jgi:hypothetical protein